MVEESKFTRLPEKFLGEIMSSAIREEVSDQILAGVDYFDYPDLLVDTGDDVCQRLTVMPQNIVEIHASSQGGMLDDYTQDGYRPRTYLTYEPTGDEPVMLVGINKVGQVQEVIYAQRSANVVGTPPVETIQETSVTFFGLDGARNSKGTKRLRLYYAPASGNTEVGDDELPPMGVFVDFRTLDRSGVVKARVYGIVGSDVGQEQWLVRGFPGNRKIFPLLGDHIPPDGSFGLMVDNSILLPIGKTTNPDFYQRLFTCSRRLLTHSK